MDTQSTVSDVKTQGSIYATVNKHKRNTPTTKASNNETTDVKSSHQSTSCEEINDVVGGENRRQAAYINVANINNDDERDLCNYIDRKDTATNNANDLWIKSFGNFQVSTDQSVLFKNRFKNPWKWLTIVCFFLTLLAIALAVAGFVYMKTGQNLDSQARQSNVDYSILQERLIETERNVSKLTNDYSILQEKLIESERNVSKLMDVVKIILTWKLYNGSIYRLTPNAQSWEKSQKVCESYGAHLATSIMNDCNALKQISQSLVINRAWIGLRTKLTKGQLLPRNKAVTSCWESGQPDNYGGNEDCVEIRSKFQYKLNDETCSASRHGLCEKMFHE